MQRFWWRILLWIQIKRLCAKTSSKLQSLEAQLATGNQQRSPSKATAHIHAEVYSSRNASTPPSVTSVSEDGNDDNISYAESWATSLVSDVSPFKKEKSAEKSSKTENSNLIHHLEVPLQVVFANVFLHFLPLTF